MKILSEFKCVWRKGHHKLIKKKLKKIDKCVFRYLCDRYSKLDKEEKIIHDDFN